MREKERLVREGYDKCQEFIQSFQEGKLQTQPGCSAEETLEVHRMITVDGSLLLYIHTQPASVMSYVIATKYCLLLDIIILFFSVTCVHVHSHPTHAHASRIVCHSS